MKVAHGILLILLFSVSCRKASVPTAPVKFTTVSGHMYSKRYQTPLKNLPMVVNRLLTGSYSFASLNEDKIIASTVTDDSGYFQMSFADTIPANTFVVAYPGKVLYGGSYSAINLDQRNDFVFYLDTIPLVYLHLHVINNHDRLEVFPDWRLQAGTFYIYPISLDTDVIWQVMPDSTYEMQFTYILGGTNYHDTTQFFTIGTYQDTFQRSMTIDASRF